MPADTTTTETPTTLAQPVDETAPPTTSTTTPPPPADDPLDTTTTTAAPAPPPADPSPAVSQFVTWTCTSSPCDWGQTLDGHAAVWPSAMSPVANRLGYTVSSPIYLPAANGLTLTVTDGNASIYAGLPDAPSHRLIASLSAGQSHDISGITTGEGRQPPVLPSRSPAPTPPPHATTAASAASGRPAAPPPPPPVDPSPAVSQFVTWTCTSSPCDWGQTLDGHAAVWPASMSPVANRLGYTVSSPIYLPAANGLTLTVTDGNASIYAGLPDAPSHRLIASLSAGQSHDISGITTGEVISLQSSQAVRLHPRHHQPPPPPPPPPDDPPPPPPPPPVDPSPGASQFVTWTCTSSPCDWGQTLDGHAAVWPSAMSPVANRLGYTVSSPIYLPAANGLTVTVTDGHASIFAGLPDAPSHRRHRQPLRRSVPRRQRAHHR